MTERLHFHFSLSCVGEGNGNTLQCSCLENPRDGGAWWAAIYGVAQSWTPLKWLSSSSSSSSILNVIGERNGNPLQHSCLENPKDRGAWWAAVYGVAQSRTQLKRLSSSSVLHVHLMQPSLRSIHRKTPSCKNKVLLPLNINSSISLTPTPRRQLITIIALFLSL